MTGQHVLFREEIIPSWGTAKARAGNQSIFVALSGNQCRIIRRIILANMATCVDKVNSLPNLVMKIHHNQIILDYRIIGIGISNRGF